MVFLTARSPSFSWIGVSILLLGIGIGIWAIQHNQPENFNIVPELKEGCCLVTTGIYRYIRHPMYTSVILMLLGVALLSHSPLSWLLWAVLIVVLYLKASREEKLWMAHDPCYAEYRKKTKYFIPYIL
jgi:protein-S-isoprenylcysteine O-methyltransferase Ste14